VPLSIAAGASVFPHDGDTYEALLAQADNRMYQDKGARKADPAKSVLPLGIEELRHGTTH
jgi:predicted signal transduction protein with EAL and GGDEF domain